MIIFEDLHDAQQRLHQRARSWLRKEGVSDETMDRYGVGLAEIDVHELAMFSFTESGKLAFVLPVRSGDHEREIIDAVAWMPANPCRWWTCRRTGWPLGDDALHHAEFFNEPVVLHPSPLAWLAAGGDGVCVLDLPRSEKDPGSLSEVALRSLPLIICEDDGHGRFVQHALTAPIPTCPAVRVMARTPAP